jgi:guanine nucleotide-binding protein G(i) subunit alpha
MDEITRIAHPGYTPTLDDIFNANVSGFHQNVRETKFFYTFGMNPQEQLRFRLQQVRRDRLRITYLAEAASVAYFVDLASYNRYQGSRTSLEMTELEETLAVFDKVVCAQSFSGSSIILYFGNAEKFRRELSETPLEQHFPDYDGGPNYTNSLQYIRQLFVGKVDTTVNSVYSRFVDSHTAETLELFALYLKKNWIE